MKPESFFSEMNCQQCREECERLLDESLTEEQRSEIEARISAHLETCPDCASEFAFVQNLRLTLPQMQNLTVAPPTFLRANVRAALVEEFGTQSQAKPRFSIPLWTRSMWAGGLVVAFGFLLISRQISPFSVEVPNSETRSSDQIVQEAPSAARDTAPMARREQKFAKQPARKSDSAEILPEKTPVPAPQVFVAPSKPLKEDSPAIELPKVKIAPIPGESPKIGAPKEDSKVESSNKPKLSAPAPVPAPAAPLADASPKIMRQRTNDGNRGANSALAKSTPSGNEQAFSARSAEALNAPAAAMAAPIAPLEAHDSATANWQTGKITLALAPAKLKSAVAGAAEVANNLDSRVDSQSEPPRTMAAKAPQPDQDTVNGARAGVGNYALRNSKIARGGGEKPEQPQAFVVPAPAPITPGKIAPATNDLPTIKAPTLIPRKLILQSEFAVSGARLLQNDKPIWEGDLPANKPVEIEFMAPVNASEKNSFVLEQIGADGESNRKSLTLGE